MADKQTIGPARNQTITPAEQLLSLSVDYVALCCCGPYGATADQLRISREVDKLFREMNHDDRVTHSQRFAEFYELVFHATQTSIH